MIKNYLKIALRSLSRQKIYTGINVLGLSIGIASCFLITMFVIDELSYDKFHAQSDRIYKIALERKYPNHSTNYAIIPHSYAEIIPQDFPEVSETVRISYSDNSGDVMVRYEVNGEEKQFEEKFLMAADSNFFNVFSIPVIKGDPQKALLNNTCIVVTESTAKKYFGDDNPLGKILKFSGRDFTVTAVCQDVPQNSHFKFALLAKWDEQFFGDANKVNFISFNSHTYIVLKPGADAAAVESKFPKMVDRYAAAQIEQALGKSWADYQKEGNGYRYFLQPLTSIHLDPTHIEFSMREGGNKNQVYFLTVVAVLILLIACINFMNLATARSSERSREVGIRKTVGSARSQLIYQFLTESILLSLFATVLAVGIIQFALPFFNILANKELEFTLTPGVVAALTGASVLVGLLAGSYPAFVLSSFNPVTVMKGSLSGSTKKTWLRNGLVVFQFFISIVLIVSTLIVANQMMYMQNKSLGYDKDKILIIDRTIALGNKKESFVEELKRIPDVADAATAGQLLGFERNFTGTMWRLQGSTENFVARSMVVDDDFANTIGFEFAEGKGFSRETHDSLYVILNETAVKTLELTDPIGKKISKLQLTPAGTVFVEFTVIGVIKDFNFQSLRDVITPLAIQSHESFNESGAYIYIKLKSENFASTLTQVEAQWKKLAPGSPFKYLFFDENLEALYESEERASKIFGVFSGLAIVIACIGLFGLVAYTASLRTKEIGVRKVLGASITNIIFLLSKEYTKLVFIAFNIAVPFAWYVMNKWLQGFAYRVELGPGIFLLAGTIAFLISWATVSYQSIKAATVNPVKSLKSE